MRATCNQDLFSMCRRTNFELSRFYASAEVVYSADRLWVCACVCASVCATQYLERSWTYLRQTISISAFWDKNERFTFWGQRSEFKVTVGPTSWRHFWALLTLHLQNYWTEFLQTFSFDAFWDKGERINFEDQKVKGWGHSMTKGAAGEGIQSSTLCAEL